MAFELKRYLVRVVQNTNLYPVARQLYKRLDLERAYYPKNKDNLGEIVAFQDVPVVPYDSLLERFCGLSVHQGGPIWPHWSEQVDARHCRNLSPVDDCPRYPESITETIEAPVIWGGAICSHFGHQIADFCTRLMHAKSVYPDATFLFAAKSTADVKTLAQTPAFFRAILDWYGIQPPQVKIVSQPLLAKQLLVAPQAEQLSNYGPSHRYLEIMDAHIEQKLTPKLTQKAVYISRGGMANCFAGEPYIELLMREVGIKVIRPETLPLQQQLTEYVSSEQLIFSAGSAVHALQLLGRFKADVQIINRRSKGRLAKNMIEMRSSSLTYLDSIETTLHGYMPSGLANDWDGITIHNEDRLIASLYSIAPKLKQLWNSTAYREQRDRDITNWLKRETQPGKSLSSASSRQIIRQLKKAGVPHLIPSLEQYLQA